MSDDQPPDDLTAKVKTWLASTGQPFEMAVAQQAMKRPLSVQQGHYYIDPDTSKAREIDVVAGQIFQVDGDVMFDFGAVIECKYASESWVILRQTPNNNATDPHFQRVATWLGGKWLSAVQHEADFRYLPLFAREPNPGYSLVGSKPGSKGKAVEPSAADVPYEALHKSVRAALAMAAWWSAEDRPWHDAFSIHFPVIALRGAPLYEAWLDGDGELMARPIPSGRGQVFWSYPASQIGRVLVDVVTEPALPDYLDDLAQAATAAFEHGTEPARRVLANPDRFQIF